MTVILETTGYRAPLALHGIDSISGADVGDGLAAIAWPQGDPASIRTAAHSPVSALLGFGKLPGLHSQELVLAQGSATLSWPAASPPAASPLPFVVTVTDMLGRFLPEAMVVDAPQTAPVDVTLYSSPARPQPPGWAMVYGEVHVDPDATPAAWALIEITDGSAAYQTISDQAGRFLFYLPYPEALPPLAGSPPASGGIGQLTWPITATVSYEPAALTWPANPAPAGPPDVFSIRAQNQAEIATAAGTQPSYDGTLSFGTPLLLLLDVVPA
jgi:hypothetical protein